MPSLLFARVRGVQRALLVALVLVPVLIVTIALVPALILLPFVPPEPPRFVG